MDYNFTSDIPEDTMPVSPEYIMSNSQKLIVPDSQGYINHEQQNYPDACKSLIILFFVTNISYLKLIII